MRRRFRAPLPGVFILLSCLVAAGQKPPAAPKGLPPYGPLVPFHPPQVTVKRLSNGLTLWLVPRAGFPKVALAVAVRGGMAADPANRPGLSYLVLDTIDQGTKTRSALEIAEAFQSAGGDLTGQPLSDSDFLTVDVLGSKVDTALSVLSDVLENATFPDAQVALARRNELDALQAREADPSFLAGRALARAIFGDHPYHVTFPTHDSLAEATAAEIREQYAREFRPDQTVLVAVGDFDTASFMDSAAKFFGKWANPSEPPVSRVEAPPQDNPHVAYLLARPHSVQTTLALAAFGPTERSADFEAVEVANAIYGGTTGSLLFTIIREEKGYGYSPRSVMRLRSKAGVLETSVSVRNAVTGACLKDIMDLLNRMATEAPAPAQVERAKRYLVGTRAIRYQLRMSVARKLASLWVDGMPPEEIGREGERIKAVTAEQVEAAGAKYFRSSRNTIVAVGDENVIQQQIKPLGIPVKNLNP